MSFRNLFILFLLFSLLLSGCTWEEFANGGTTQREERAPASHEISERSLSQRGQKCFDTDGGEKWDLFGEVKVYENGAETSFPDRCLNGTTLSEGFCEGSAYVAKGIACVYGCENGVCLPEPSAEPITILINGKEQPDPIKRGTEFTLSWSAPDARNCAGSGHYIPLVDGGYWTEQRNLPSEGSMQLLAEHKNVPDVRVLQLLMSCTDESDNQISKTVIIPVLD